MDAQSEYALEKIGKNHQGEKYFDCVKEQKEWAVEWARKQISLYVAMSTTLVLEFMFFVQRSICLYTPTCISAQAYARRCHRTMEKPFPAYNNISLLYLIPDESVTKIILFYIQVFNNDWTEINYIYDLQHVCKLASTLLRYPYLFSLGNFISK